VSRSYKKFPSGYREIWKDSSIRTQNRLCIHREMRSSDYGDVIFPVTKEYSKICRGGYHDFKKKTRDEYFLDIRNILNGCTKRFYYRIDKAFDEIFIEDFKRIKNSASGSSGEWGCCFEWLNNKNVKEAVKSWAGEPLDLLKFLTDRGLIERAVRQKVKVEVKK